MADRTKGSPEHSNNSAISSSSMDAIAEIIRSIPRGDHLTAPEVYELAKQRGLKLSLSTVYRTLNKLKVVGDVITVSGDRGLRYESVEDQAHDHLICLGCGLTIEFFDDLIRGFGHSVALRKGFEHTTSRFDILGYCEKCKGNDEGHKQEQMLDNLLGAIEKTEAALEDLKAAADLMRTRKTARVALPVKTARQKLTDASQELDYLSSFFD
ncbi:MAG TPA: transcriptional repressor [Candidatus Obscuribacter sp.]|nr:transcriptional repressor [Candidatus Obscuribacter sp.]MBK9278839.1 transcriptional repressor [Candidatus Obscuribacter sp.]HMW90924.1 transcriptional repressor [Candidatus Obscuribacter sp.]HMX45404.1 transcriptional repressor [Candidatus Obscuribacter sp.]HMY05016.1 transcriptional repressor [Candidatus Obscuribacter sp.]